MTRVDDRAPPASPSRARYLLTAAAIRERCGQIMAVAERGETAWFRWQPEKLAACADYVVAVIRERFPDLDVPYHSRWRHFEAGGVDRWGPIAAGAGLDESGRHEERARTEIDLAVTSVLLDAGAGADWSYRDAATGQTLARSEGLGVASLAMFASGAFSSDTGRPLRADSGGLRAVDPRTLRAHFHVDEHNRLVGVEGRVTLLRNLGIAVGAAPAMFASGRSGGSDSARVGGLFDYLRERSVDGAVSARLLLETLLDALGGVWPSRDVLDGVALGDCWRHPAAVGDGPDDPTGGYVPFHKLTQWLAYSLLEPLARGGLGVTGLDALTGLPEYRNGGLLIDTGVLTLVDPDLREVSLTVDHPAVVEWRALTVIALDRLADAVRARLQLSAEAFPLARVLEGGTWAAGRKIAAEKRPGGAPPLRIVSDGTVF